MSIIWQTKTGLTPYQDSLSEMEDYVLDIHKNGASDKVILLEHPDIYTAGVSAQDTDLLDKNIPLIKTGRGGKITYHGPGMRIAYVMLDLKRREELDVRKYIQNLEKWIISALCAVGVSAFIREERVGIWVENKNGGEDKIGAIGVRLRKWISYHGIALNIDPDLVAFQKIIPCGIDNPKYGVTSLKKLGIEISMKEFDKILKDKFTEVFGE